MQNRLIIYAFLALIISGLFAGRLSAQPNPALKKSITITSRDIRLDSLLRVFSRQTGIGFSFNSNKITPSKKIAVSAKTQTLQQWLLYLRQVTGVDYKWVGNHVILVNNPGQHTFVKHSKTQQSVPLRSSKKIISAEPVKTSRLAAVPKSTTSARQLVTPIRQTALIDDTAAQLLPDSMNKLEREARPVYDSISASKKDTLQQHVEKDSAEHMRNEITKAGKTAEVSTVHPALVGADDATRNESKSRERRPRESSAVVPLTKIDLGPQGLGISFERRLSQKTIIDLSLGLGGGYAITGKQFKYKVDGLSGPDIYASVNPRWYYNRGKRFAANKSLKANAGNYFGFRIKYVTDYVAENFVVWDALLFNFHWGIQRPLGRSWVVNGHIGPGYGFAQNLIYNVRLTGLNHVYPSLEFKISYLFNKER